MEFARVFENYPYLLSVRKDGEDMSVYDKLLDELKDIGAVIVFLEENREFLRNDVWNDYGNVESAARRIAEEADEMEETLERLVHNTLKGTPPDLDSVFHYLNGEFSEVYEHTPVKSYGSGDRPSFLRLYAIKFASNQYVITGGGIKLGSKIQNSPGLKEHVIEDIKAVREWLKKNYVDTIDDI